MSFFARLFQRKHVVQGQRLQRSVTAQEAHQSSSSSSENDEDIRPLTCLTEPLVYRRTVCDAAGFEFTGRRVGGEIRRSVTANGAIDMGYRSPAATTASRDQRSSMSSSNPGSMDDRLRQQYSKIKLYHRGKKAAVMEGMDRTTKRPVVIKAYTNTSSAPQRKAQVGRELSMLKAADGCTGIVKLLNTLEDGPHTYLVLEAVPGYTLIQLAANNGGRLTESYCAVQVVYPLLKALASLHALGIVHRDIKPEHIMCTYGSVKLLDFAEAAQLQHRNLNHRVGQLEYMAPEVLSKPSVEDVFHEVLYNGMSEEELPQYDEKADIWSTAVVVFEVLTGVQPFMADTVQELAECHARLSSQVSNELGLPELLLQSGLSVETCQFLAAMMQVDPAARPSAAELLEHPWLKSHMARKSNQWLLPKAISSPAAAPTTIVTAAAAAAGGVGKVEVDQKLDRCCLMPAPLPMHVPVM